MGSQLHGAMFLLFTGPWHRLLSSNALCETTKSLRPYCIFQTGSGLGFMSEVALACAYVNPELRVGEELTEG